MWAQHVKKNRDPRWDEEFTFMCEEPPVNDRIHVEVVSRPPSIGIHSKVGADRGGFFFWMCSQVNGCDFVSLLF